MKNNSSKLNTIFLGLITISMLTYSTTNIILPNGFGIDQSSPASKLDVNGNMTVGSTYSGTNAAPTDGAIIEGDVGVGVTSPNTKVDIDGDMAIRESTVNIGNDGGDNTFDDLVLNSTHSFIRITGPNDNFDITGITGGVDGRMLILYNSTDHDMKFKYDDVLSGAANRIYGQDDTDVTVKERGTAILVYSTADSRWVVIGKF